MSQNPKDNDLSTRYVLGGQLPDQEESLIEDLLFTNDEYLENLSILEDELIESHLRGQLTDDEDTLFQRRLAISPRLRERVEWVKRHMASPSGSEGHLVASLPGAPQRAASWWESAQIAWQRHQLAGAASVAGLALFFISLLTVIQWSGARELKRRLAEQSQSNRELATQLESERTRHESPDRGIAQVRTASPLAMVSLILTPADEVQAGQRRGTGGESVELAPQAAVLELQMTPRVAGYGKFRGVIETVEGEEILTQNDLTAAQVDGQTRVLWDLSAHGLPPNDYIVSLYGIALDGKHVLAGVFSFHLRKAAR